ncbi:hypothetical protein FA13DRAFT_561873 [Coprinellus micaceus]|uniref:Uncharacterized protein n=1 Tax=Coprinellus micaceus TaxID=71717 RepID=A0A4Y7SAM8_COPMI|nr:hypothetical protein FA13DRAFT_561873 [Coprinellus micaceus]
MIWSSAQPHSVDDMVGHGFPGKKDELVAIWARDTLGFDPGGLPCVNLRLYFHCQLTLRARSQDTNDQRSQKAMGRRQALRTRTLGKVHTGY